MTRSIDAWIVNAFTDGGTGGNPACVVPEADGLSNAEKQRVAREIGLSETAFVSRSDIATVKLEFFTPTRQIAHCGHATIATFSLLHAQGRVGEGRLSKETIDGTRPILIEDGRVFMGQRAPRYEDIDDAATLAHIRDSLRVEGLPHGATVVDTGNRFLLAELRDAGAVAALAPDMGAVTAISETHDLVGYYVFARESRRPGRIATTRMFAPRYGIDEEAGTGMAAGPLACLLHDRDGAPARVVIEQGALMTPASPSEIEVRLDVVDGAIQRLIAGGRATVGERRRLVL
jgi:PhzF family phenazine biosynthesis protein